MSKSFLVLLNPFLVQLVSDFLRDRQEFLDSHHDYDGLFGFAASKIRPARRNRIDSKSIKSLISGNTLRDTRPDKASCLLIEFITII